MRIFYSIFLLVELDKIKRTKKNIELLEKSKTLAFNPIKFVWHQNNTKQLFLPPKLNKNINIEN